MNHKHRKMRILFRVISKLGQRLFWTNYVNRLIAYGIQTGGVIFLLQLPLQVMRRKKTFLSSFQRVLKNSNHFFLTIK